MGLGYNDKRTAYRPHRSSAMKRLLLAIALALLTWAPTASAQAPVVQCVQSGTSCIPVQNRDVALVTMTAQAQATVTSDDQTNLLGRCATVVVDLTTMTTASVTVTIQGKDSVSGKYYTLLAGAAKTSTGTTPMWVCPGVAASSNVSIALPLPTYWRISIAVADNSGTAAVTGKVSAAVTQ